MFLQRNGDRPWAPNTAIIITDGVPMLPVDVGETMARKMTIDEANFARAQGINIFAIGELPCVQISSLVIVSFPQRRNFKRDNISGR